MYMWTFVYIGHTVTTELVVFPFIDIASYECSSISMCVATQSNYTLQDFVDDATIECLYSIHLKRYYTII